MKRGTKGNTQYVYKITAYYEVLHVKCYFNQHCFLIGLAMTFVLFAYIIRIPLYSTIINILICT